MSQASCPGCGHRFGWRGPRVRSIRENRKVVLQWPFICPKCEAELRSMKTPAQRWVAGIIYVIGVGYSAGLLWHMIDRDSAPSMDILLVGLIAHLVLGFWQLTWPSYYVTREPARSPENRVSWFSD